MTKEEFIDHVQGIFENNLDEGEEKFSPEEVQGIREHIVSTYAEAEALELEEEAAMLYTIDKLDKEIMENIKARGGNPFVSVPD